MREPEAKAASRVDGPKKVRGAAPYAAEYAAPDLVYGCVVSSTIARGRILAIDTAAALEVPGVVYVLTNENRPRTARLSFRHKDLTAPPGKPFQPLFDDKIAFSGEPVALVLAEDLGAARYAASLVRVRYQAEPHETDLWRKSPDPYEPGRKRTGIKRPAKSRGDAERAFEASPVKVRAEYRVPIEHHNPLELQATTAVWEDGRLRVYDKTQGVNNNKFYLRTVFGLAKSAVEVVSPFVGGAFGTGLRPQYPLFLAVMAAQVLKRSVRVVLTRAQMFTIGYRAGTRHTLKLGAETDGRLNAIDHEALACTSRFEDFQEDVVNWSGILYRCDNVALSYKLARLDTNTPIDMRAPGAAPGVFALETAMDELAYEVGVDPVELRLRNYSERDQSTDEPYTSKELRACYSQAALRFGWSTRKAAPRSMREGRELVGLGMASGIWTAGMGVTFARVTLSPGGKLEVTTAASDIGTGTYTILAQLAADALGLPLADVAVKLADSALPFSSPEGNSTGAATAGTAVQSAAAAVRREVFEYARGADDSPLAGARPEDVIFAGGRIALARDPARGMTLAEVMAAAGVESISKRRLGRPSLLSNLRYSSFSHSAVFAEVRVDEELGVVRVTRVVSAIAAGRILNPKTARSQIIGGVVFGLGMALHEESLIDQDLGRFMNHDFGEYHVPTCADVPDIEVIFVEERDEKTSPIGVKGLGEIGVVGVAAAIGNAVYHATGRRIRELPIRLDKLL
jgi:xanthine dehydrogenase YagR molybdenum-binding subunit